MKLPTSEGHLENRDHVSWYIIAYKLLFGLAEFSLGFGIALFGQTALKWYRLYTVQELSEDPHDLLVHITQGIIPSVLAHHTYLVIYLILLGGAKIVGAIGIIYNQDWGIDLLVGLTILILPFQIARLAFHPSFIELSYVLLGLLITMYLINFRPHVWINRIKTKLKSILD